jgi:hypothetical protein
MLNEVPAAKNASVAAVVAPVKQKKKREADVECYVREMECGSFAKHIKVVAFFF